MKQKATRFLLLSTSLLLGSCSWFNNAEDIYDESETSSSEQVSSSASDETSENPQSSQSSSTAEVAPALTVANYFPMIEGYQAVFEGDGNEYAGFSRTYDYIEDDTIYMRTNNGGTSVLELVEVTEDAVRVVYTQPEFYAHEKIDAAALIDPENTETLLEAPIALGHSWETGLGTTREITAIGVPMSTQNDLYDTIEVTEDTGDFVNKEYYAAGVGLVYASSESTDPDAPYTVVQDLAELSTEGWAEPVSVYYPVTKDEYTQASESVNITTNDDMTAAFTSLFQSENDSRPQLLPADAAIQSLTTETNEETFEKTLYVDFSSGIIALADDEWGMQKLNSIMASSKSYYNADHIEPRIDGDPIEIDGLVGLNEANPVFEIPESVMNASMIEE
ncbi:Uncharacterised protein [Aerococcus viridans]|uniref:GerMN domain-containing protein n=2 Tax=Aerococcus viridans TaxID=1377 RepID=A0AAU8U4C2_9LACT|nr:GerMN domain-containing protein [Aerococcus viridans]AMC00108.1 hypothetical protein AWM76_00215 [Aerococcus viridans]EFG49441.1 hypothetical protein HMPREF0061_1259 [Aerococcus viridans ATCC 11563 = CCUG 4311]SUU11122.1 Uncharacterised protein [Aerococcus viridans]